MIHSRPTCTLGLLVLSGCLLFGAPAAHAANSYYVALTGSDTNPGSQSLPFRTIQHGLDTANSGDSVYVFSGWYAGAGNRDLDFNGKSILLSQFGSGTVGWVIDCNYAGRGFYFHSMESSTAIVNGFTILHGHAPDGQAGTEQSAQGQSGGGMLIENASPTILNCAFKGCRSGDGSYYDEYYGEVGGDGGNGGGVQVTNGSPTFANCVFTHNNGGQGFADPDNENAAAGGGGGSGGAFSVTNGTVDFESCSFDRNGAGPGGDDYGGPGNGGDGGAICAVSSSITLHLCALEANSAGGGGSNPPDEGYNFVSGGLGGAGGGLCASDCQLTLEDCYFGANRAGGGGTSTGESLEVSGGPGGYGGGMALYGDSARIMRCRFSGNGAGSGGDSADGANAHGGDGGGIALASTSLRLAQCLFFRNFGGDGGNGGDGGGIAVEDSSSIHLSSCAFVANGTGWGEYTPGGYGVGGSGGGMYVDSESEASVINCTFTANTTGDNVFDNYYPLYGLGGGLENDSTTTEVVNSIFYFDTDYSGAVDEIEGSAQVTTSDVQGAANDLGNPRFKRLPGTQGYGDSGDLRLTSSSPCIDVGDNRRVSWLLSDLNGNPRIVNATVDLGAYEFQRLTNVTGQMQIEFGSIVQQPGTSTARQQVTLTNRGGEISGPVFLVSVGLPTGVELLNTEGVTVNTLPYGSPYIRVMSVNLGAGQRKVITLTFNNSNSETISYTALVVAGGRP